MSNLPPDEKVILFDKSKHVQYIVEQESHRSFEYWLSEHLRMNGLYWGVTALITMNELSALAQQDVIDYIMLCWDDKQVHLDHFQNMMVIYCQHCQHYKC